MESQSSTLPRAGRGGKSLPQSATANVQSNGSSQQLTDATASEAPSIAGKRRSAAHSYRMQTESSLAKVNAGKELSAESSSVKGGVSRKESYTMMRFPSTPNITAEDREVDGRVESVQNSQRRSSVEGVDESQGLQMDGHSSGGAASGVDVGRLIDGSDRTLMPPPLSTSVPQSYHATFIAKAAKHRRTTMPESLARSRELLAGAIAKHHRLSDTSATDDDDSAPSSSSSACMLATLDASPLEPPERDGQKMRVSSAHVTDASARNLSNVECGSVTTGTKVEHSESASSAGSSVTGSPQVVKIGRCVSPIRPQSASTNVYRRQLPPDPRLSVSLTTAASDSVMSSALSQVSVTRSASAESGMRLVESSLDPDVSKQHTSPVQRSPVPQQASGQRPISSKTETRLVLDPEHNVTENLTSTAQQTIINEIARFCTERRMSADRASQQEQRVAETGTVASPAGHTRQQWEKTKPFKPLIIKSQSNSSVSQTVSSSACDSLALADVSSLSKNSIGSVSSSCFTQDTTAVAASVSDSVISYVSVQLPTKLVLTAAGSASDVETAESTSHTVYDVTKGSKADEDEQTSVMKPAEHTDSSLAQPASEQSSDG